MSKLPVGSNRRAGRAFFYLLLALVIAVTFVLIWPYLGAVVLAATVAVVLHPTHRFFVRVVGGRAGIATAFTLTTVGALIVIPTLVGLYLLRDTFSNLADDVATNLGQPEARLLPPI